MAVPLTRKLRNLAAAHGLRLDALAHSWVIGANLEMPNIKGNRHPSEVADPQSVDIPWCRLPPRRRSRRQWRDLR